MECQNCGVNVAEVVSRRTGGYCDGCDLMTIPEAARRLHVSRFTVYRLMRQGKISKVHPCLGRTLIRRAEIEALLRLVDCRDFPRPLTRDPEKAPSVGHNSSENVPQALEPVPEQVRFPSFRAGSARIGSLPHRLNKFPL